MALAERVGALMAIEETEVVLTRQQAAPSVLLGSVHSPAMHNASHSLFIGAQEEIVSDGMGDLYLVSA